MYNSPYVGRAETQIEGQLQVAVLPFKLHHRLLITHDGCRITPGIHHAQLTLHPMSPFQGDGGNGVVKHTEMKSDLIFLFHTYWSLTMTEF